MINCLRLFLIKPQCAQVMVAPELNSNNVLTAGRPHAAIGVNLGGTNVLPSTVPPGPADGHVPKKSLYGVKFGSKAANQAQIAHACKTVHQKKLQKMRLQNR